MTKMAIQAGILAWRWRGRSSWCTSGREASADVQVESFHGNYGTSALIRVGLGTCFDARAKISVTKNDRTAVWDT